MTAPQGLCTSRENLPPGVAFRSAREPPSAQRRRTGSYTTSRDANGRVAPGSQVLAMHKLTMTKKRIGRQ